MPIRLILILALSMSAIATRSAATELHTAIPAPHTTQALFVELIVNGVSSETIVPLQIADDRMMIEGHLLRRSGLAFVSEGLLDLATLQGVRSSYDIATQTLNLDVEPELLPARRVSSARNTRLPTVADYGAMLNYDAYAQRSGGATTASLWSEQRLFGPAGTLSNSGTIRLASGGGAKAKAYLRFDTSFRHVDENRAVVITAGDLITRSLPWNRSFRLGGVQISRDFRIRPDLVTVPLPSFAGKTAVPSAVDLFVDGFHRQNADVAPGRFILDDVPVVTGAGQATIVTRDAVGRQISTTIPFYVSSELLRAGLLDFSAEAGFLRRHYGVRSFDYGQLTATGTGRYGVTRQITVESHGEAAKGHSLIGGGLLWAPWVIGTFNLTASHNWTRGKQSNRWSAGYSYTSRHFSVSFDHEERRAGFRDLGSFDLRQIAELRRSDRMIATLNLARQGSFGVAYVSGKTLNKQKTRIISGSYSRALGRAMTLFATGDYDFRSRTGSVQLRLIVPFGRNLVAGGISHDKSRGTLAQLDFNRSIASDGGLGIDASLASDSRGHHYGQATGTWRTHSIELQAGAAAARGVSSKWASAAGSVVIMAGDIFVSRRISDSFAVVSTGDVADVPVSFENQPVGTTDKKGLMFVPNVTSHLGSRFAIDTLNLPPDHQASSVELTTAIRQGAGAVIRMPIRKVRSATVALVDAAGLPLPAGSLVTRPGRQDSSVGWDGIAYLEDMERDNPIAVSFANGTGCRANVNLPDDAPPLVAIGPLPCL